MTEELVESFEIYASVHGNVKFSDSNLRRYFEESFCRTSLRLVDSMTAKAAFVICA